MPVLLKQNNPTSTLALWQITESEAELRRLVTADDARGADRLGCAARRTERLAWRAALRTIIPESAVGYNALGAPVLNPAGTRHLPGASPSGPAGHCPGRPDNLPAFLSAAHTQGYAAVIVSDRPCAIDIERRDRDFSRATPRYISEAESRLPGADHPAFAAIAWCAKETLYKQAAVPGLDFLHDLRLISLDPARGTVTASVARAAEAVRRMAAAGPGPARGPVTLELPFLLTDDLCIVYTPA
ncbi:MAG: 4'-phosphopantetheinyl transferase superfamily protein [Rikenellaceae bacterium]|nr:4'-phosphopantetheinyl transferase superfamily protein [Rikenellaceae bacterium]